MMQYPENPKGTPSPFPHDYVGRRHTTTEIVTCIFLWILLNLFIMFISIDFTPVDQSNKPSCTQPAVK